MDSMPLISPPGTALSVVRTSLEAGENCWYLLLKAALTASTVAPSVTVAARTGMRSSSTCSAPSGFDEISRYQRPLRPRTERTKTSPSTTTTQMIVRCSGESPSRRVSMRTSLVSSRSLRVSASKVSFIILLSVAFCVDDLAEGFACLPAAGSAGLLVWVAEGDRSPYYLLLWYTQ